MNILITGASGFLGRYLVQYLHEKNPSDSLYTICRNPVKLAGVEHSVLNMNEEEKLAALIQKVQPEQIYHLAGIARVSESIGLPDYFEHNTRNTITLLRVLSQIKKPVSLFFSSSVHVYGNQTETVDENSPVHPASPYAFTKFLAEKAVAAYTEENPHLRAVVGRIYSCIGPGQSEGFVAADLCKKIHALPDTPGAVLKVGPLKSYRRFLDVRDVVKTFPKLLESKSKNRFEIYNLASPHELQIEEMLGILIRLSKKNPKVESSDMSHNQFKGLQINADKLYELVPPGQFRPVEQTLKDMLEYRH